MYEYEARDKILFNEAKANRSKFKIGFQEFKELLDRKIIQPRNDTLYFAGVATPQKYLEFLQKHPAPGWTIHGRIIDYWQDSGVLIEGFQKNGKPTREEIIDFSNMFHNAGEFKVSEDGLFCHYENLAW